MVFSSIRDEIDNLASDFLQAQSTFVEFREYQLKTSQLFIGLFNQNTAVVELLHGRSYCIDRLLAHLWQQHLGQYASQLSLIAVGGYGRGELHPYSDIDLLILCPNRLSGFEQQVQSFITCLWDSGLEIGHSVRSLKECKKQAKNDITIATNILESRVLNGNSDLFQKMRQMTETTKIWSDKKFFAAKYQEQRNRHFKFQKTSYSLEPNIKKSPGTLRDIQLIGWVAKHHFNVQSLSPLVELGFLTKTEFMTLQKCEAFLWRVRFALHIVAGRAEDRLLFDHQRPVAQMLGIADSRHFTDVEQLMKRYYRVVKSIRELNDMLLQNFSETILIDDTNHRIIKIDADFQIHGEQIEICHDNVFRDNPACLLKLFLHMADHPELKGVRAPTLRRIMIDRELINNEKFRSDDHNKALFLQLFQHPRGAGKPLILMKRYGVLKAYLPAFARIVGQMQYDLFHIYTVDEHTLFVVNNIAGFTEPESRELFPLCTEIIKKIQKPYLLYLAALFHDIGKGQGGNHSIIGADEAMRFCRLHRMSEEDSELVVWLVQQHLLMSRTAQRQDITDPEIINHFAQEMATIEQLNNLYLLTVADIRATNPNLWNNWKDSLLQNLYQLTYKALDRGLENPKEIDEAIQEVKNQVINILISKRISENAIENLWSNYKDDYFIRNVIGRIAWQTEKIIKKYKPDVPLISHYRHQNTGTSELFVYMTKHPNYFTLITTLLYEKNLSIQDATMHTTNDGFILGSFVALEIDGQPISRGRRMENIKSILRNRLAKPDKQLKPLKRKTPHRYSHFDIKTKVTFSLSENGKRTSMMLVALDKPGLLARIGQAFLQLDIELHSAKVVTLGEKVEDTFSITNRNEQPLETLEEQQQLRQLIEQYVESDDPEIFNIKHLAT